MNITHEKNAHASLFFSPSVRPMSASSLAMLHVIGSPIFDAVLRGQDISDLAASDLLDFAFIHCADLHQVIELVANYKKDPSAFHQAVFFWGGDKMPEALTDIASDIAEQTRATREAMSEVVPDSGAGGHEKKALTPLS